MTILDYQSRRHPRWKGKCRMALAVFVGWVLGGLAAQSAYEPMLRYEARGFQVYEINNGDVVRSYLKLTLAFAWSGAVIGGAAVAMGQSVGRTAAWIVLLTATFATGTVIGLAYARASWIPAWAFPPRMLLKSAPVLTAPAAGFLATLLVLAAGIARRARVHDVRRD